MRWRRIAGALTIVLLGVMFLLANAGTLDLSVWWLVLGHWPILLILAGIDVLLGDRLRWFGVIVLLLVIVLGTVGVGWKGIWAGGPAEKRTYAPPEGSPAIASLRAELTLDALGATVGPPSSGAYRLELAYRNAQEPTQSYEVSGDVGVLRLGQKLPRSGPFGGLGGPGVWGLSFRQSLTMGFAPDVPLDLHLTCGALHGDLDLSGYRLRLLDLTAGAATAKVRLGCPVGRSEVRITAGAAGYEISVPRDVPISLKVGIGLKILDLPGLKRIGNRWQDDAYADASEVFDLDVSGGVAWLSVKRY